ncbi:ABC transporter permease subunit [Sporosarcina sp. Te-1]|uniref:ABC transporter permease subunit n=1 Tax=Sporosarcina sp. Te-1 TaxID=2818390 RepID=UPI001A9E2CAB|nr:ABC transporter permease subunit [Sporosarcina sp. Te-1]QTD40018.1 ABC transporter permease subunit [Sporosarcina sp. Te-1]
MSLFKFELKKIWRQKKWFWMLVVVLLCAGLVFYQNQIEQDLMVKEAEEKLFPVIMKTDQLYAQLRPLDRENRLTEEQKIQFDSLNNMATAIFHWKSAIYKKHWEEIPQWEKEFLENLVVYEEAGGVFDKLQGLERDKAISKNALLIEHQLPYANETYPISPFLQLNKLAAILLGPAGLLLLLLLFGSAYTSEKEQQTVLTVRTQPVLRRSFLLSKYAGLLGVTLLYVATVLAFGWVIPSLFGDSFNDWKYPVFLEAGDAFTLIPAWQYTGRLALLFTGAGAFLFAFLLVVGTQLKNSFTAVMLTGFLTMIGVVLTEIASKFQVPWNPFQLFRGDRFLPEYPDYPIWIYAISALLWCALLVTIAVFLREGTRGLFSASEEQKPFRKGRPHHLLSALTISAFEWRKSKRKGLLGQIMVVLAIAVVAGYVFLAEQVKEKESETIGKIANEPIYAENELIPYYEESIRETEESIQEANRNGENGEFIYGHNIDYYNDRIVEAREKAALAAKAAVAYEQEEWAPLYDYQLYEDQQRLGIFAESKKGVHLPESFFGYEAAILQKEWMKERNIRPVFPGSYISNIHEQWKPEERRAKKWNNKMNRNIDHSGLFSLYMVFRDYLFFIPMCLLFLLVGSGFSGERGKRPTLHLLETMPIKRRSLFLGKTIHASLTAMGSAVVIFLFVVLVGTLFNRLGDWMYPVLRYHSNYEKQSFDFTGNRAFEGGYTFMPLGDYLLKALLLYVCVTLFLIALANIIGLVARQPLVVYALTSLISGAGYLLSWKLNDFAQFSPFLYLNVPKIVNGEILTLLNNPAISVTMACAMLLGTTVILLVVTYIGMSFEQRGMKKRKPSVAEV